MFLCTKAGTPGKTSWAYSDRGELTSVIGTGGTVFERTFVSNREGQVLGRKEKSGNIYNYLYYQGNPVATVGNASTPTITDTYKAIRSESPGLTPSSYVVIEGDTLQGVAQTVWGDSNMWYLIADANGLDASSTLTTGDTLIIPNVVSSTHNDDGTFKPYNPEAVIGNTTPSPKPPPPPKVVAAAAVLPPW